MYKDISLAHASSLRCHLRIRKDSTEQNAEQGKLFLSVGEVQNNQFKTVLFFLLKISKYHTNPTTSLQTHIKILHILQILHPCPEMRQNIVC